MRKEATGGEIAAVTEKISALGLTPHAIPGAQRIAIGITGNKEGLEPAQFIMVEVHPDPACALSDGPQALTFPMFEKLMREVRPIAALVGRAAEQT